MTTQSPPDLSSGQPPEIMAAPHLPALLRARWRLPVTGLVLGLLAGLWLAATMPTQYDAAATVKLGAGFVAAGTVTNDTVAASTQAEVAGLRPQVEEVAEALEVDPDVVADRLSIANRPGTALVDFTYSAPTARAAEQGAQTAARMYLEHARQSAETEIQARMEFLRQRATKAAPGKRDSIAADLRALRLTVFDTGSVVRTAQGSAERSVLVPAVYLGLGALGGLVLGGMLAVLVEAVRPRVRPGAPVAGLTFLGRITEDTGPHDAAGMLMPTMVAGEADVLVVPVGACADAVAELLERSLSDVRMIGHTAREDLQTATASGNVVLVVREGERLRQVRSMVATFAIVGVQVRGMVAVSSGAIHSAMALLTQMELTGEER